MSLRCSRRRRCRRCYLCFSMRFRRSRCLRFTRLGLLCRRILWFCRYLLSLSGNSGCFLLLRFRRTCVCCSGFGYCVTGRFGFSCDLRLGWRCLSFVVNRRCCRCCRCFRGLLLLRWRNCGLRLGRCLGRCRYSSAAGICPGLCRHRVRCFSSGGQGGS